MSTKPLRMTLRVNNSLRLAISLSSERIITAATPKTQSFNAAARHRPLHGYSRVVWQLLWTSSIQKCYIILRKTIFNELPCPRTQGCAFMHWRVVKQLLRHNATVTVRLYSIQTEHCQARARVILLIEARTTISVSDCTPKLRQCECTCLL